MTQKIKITFSLLNLNGRGSSLKKMKLFVLTCLCIAANALTRTKIESGGLYKLQNQNDGRFLTAGKGGAPSRQEWRAGSDQKFTFVLTKTNNEDSWKLTPIDNMNALVPQYKITYVGHGKSLFKSFTSGLCLIAQGSSGVGEGACARDDPKQRWYIDNTTPEAKS